MDDDEDDNDDDACVAGVTVVEGDNKDDDDADPDEEAQADASGSMERKIWWRKQTNFGDMRETNVEKMHDRNPQENTYLIREDVIDFRR